MKILILNWRDVEHPLAGGAEQSLFKHALYWKKQGADITWISSSFPEASNEKAISGIKVLRMGSHYTVHLKAARYYRKLTKADIVIDCFHFVPYFSPFYIRRKNIIALINEPAKNAWFKNTFFLIALLGYIVEPLFYKFYREITFITSAKSIQKELVHLGIKPGKISVIEHGVTIVRRNKKFFREKIPTIIYLSQVSSDKGIEDAIKALKHLREDGHNIKLWIVGKSVSDEYERKIKQQIVELNLKESIMYLGFVTDEKKYELLQKAWILIHPSIREGWGLNVIEANSFGVPAVGFDVTGLRDSIQDNMTGLLTKKNTPLELAVSCKKIINNPKLYYNLSTNAIKWARNFTWDKAGEKSWKLISEQYAKNEK